MSCGFIYVNESVKIKVQHPFKPIFIMQKSIAFVAHDIYFLFAAQVFFSVLSRYFPDLFGVIFRSKVLMIRPNSSSFQFLLGPCPIWHLSAEDQEKLVKIFVAKGLENGKLACWRVMALPAQGELHAELRLVYEPLRKLVWKTRFYPRNSQADL